MSRASQAIWFENPNVGQRSRIVTLPNETDGRQFVLEYINRLQAAITIQGLAKAGRVNAKGLPNLLQLGVLIETPMPATYLAGPPIALQRVLFGMLGWAGRLAGYKTAYRDYGVITASDLEMPA